MIRGAAKNHKDVVIIPSQQYYISLMQILEDGPYSTFVDRLRLLMPHLKFP